MPEPLGDFESYCALFRAHAERMGFEDYHAAIGDVDNGRYRKHRSGGVEIDPATGKKRDRLRETLEWLLANDAEYARLHGAAVEAVNGVATLLDETQVALRAAIATNEAAIADAEDRAARLPDGTRVFRHDDGTVRDADGKVISDADAATIQWRGDEPSYAEYRALLDQRRALKAAAQDVLLIETDLGALQGVVWNEDQPAMKARLGQVPDDADALRDRLKNIATVASAEAGAAVKVDAAKQKISEDLDRAPLNSVPLITPGQ